MISVGTPEYMPKSDSNNSYLLRKEMPNPE